MLADEHCELAIRGGGLSLIGTILGSEDGVPVRIEYRVLADGAGLTSAKGVWTVDGVAARALKGCTDIDLGCSPSTNALPIRRLRLGVGASSTIQAAWVLFPTLEVVKAAQTYTRLDEFTYRYDSGDFSAELTVDEDGLVARYADWKRTGFAFGPEDPESLDSP